MNWKRIDPRRVSEFRGGEASGSTAGNEFARASGRFDLTARGKVNTYGLFAELFANLGRERAGVIVPTGIAPTRRRLRFSRRS